MLQCCSLPTCLKKRMMSQLLTHNGQLQPLLLQLTQHFWRVGLRLQRWPCLQRPFQLILDGRLLQPFQRIWMGGWEPCYSCYSQLLLPLLQPAVAAPLPPHPRYSSTSC